VPLFFEAGGSFFAAADAAGSIWTAFLIGSGAQPGTSVQVVRVTPTTGERVPSVPLSGSTATNLDPFVLVDGSNAVWVFWVAEDGIMSQRFQPGAVTPDGPTVALPGTNIGTLAARISPSATIDATGAIWVFWVTDGGTPPTQVFSIRRDPVTQAWGPVKRITSATGTDSHQRTFAETAPNGVVWSLFKRATGAANTELVVRQIFTVI
jgi:hypothetical protein